MEKNNFKVRDYLRSHDARGANKAVPMEEVAAYLFGDGGEASKRLVRKAVYEERCNGALICSSTTGHSGYFLPVTPGEVVAQWRKLEAGIKKKARPLRPFREFVGRVKKSETQLVEGLGLFPDTNEPAGPNPRGIYPAEPPKPARNPHDTYADMVRAAMGGVMLDEKPAADTTEAPPEEEEKKAWDEFRHAKGKAPRETVTGEPPEWED